MLNKKLRRIDNIQAQRKRLVHKNLIISIMTNLPDWIMAGCAVFSLIVAVVALRKSDNASSQVHTLNSQVNSLTSQITNLSTQVTTQNSQIATLTTEMNKVSSDMKNSKIKQQNKNGDSNTFIGGNVNG